MGGDDGEVATVAGKLVGVYPIGVEAGFAVDRGTAVYVSEDFPVSFVHYYYYWYYYGIDEASVFVAVDDNCFVAESFAGADCFAPTLALEAIDWTFSAGDDAS